MMIRDIYQGLPQFGLPKVLTEAYDLDSFLG